MVFQYCLDSEAHWQEPEERNDPTATDKAPWLLKAAKMCADSGKECWPVHPPCLF